MTGLIVDICRFYFTQSISFIKEHACILQLPVACTKQPAGIFFSSCDFFNFSN